MQEQSQTSYQNPSQARAANEERQGPVIGISRIDKIPLLAPQWCIYGFLEADTLGMLFGAPGSGKSFVALDMAASVASGTPWCGHAVTQAPVLYVAGEGHNGLARRRWAWEKARGISLDGRPFYVTDRAVLLTEDRERDALLPVVEQIQNETGHKPGLIVVDTVARNFGPGDENSTTDMNRFVRAVDTLRRHADGATTLLVHHTGHGERARARGSIALNGALDAEYRLDAGEQDEPGRFKPTKVKEGAFPPEKAFYLPGVPLGLFDHAGEPVTSAVPEYVDPAQLPPEQDGELSGNQRRGLTVLRELCENAANDSHVEEGQVPGVTQAQWYAAMAQSGIAKSSRSDVKYALQNRGLIQADGGFVRPI